MAYRYNHAGMQVHCVIDENHAAKYAKSRGFDVISTARLMRLLREKNGISGEKCRKIMKNIPG
ncbi:MAG: hypothetical protein MPI95_05375 [Nitrosopumilus sp.]|nr:hypothetical protein [Nitrosopumilus sp.]CAI9831175.1 hypothetical protein IBTHAUMO2_190038 [Nitrosopumilaceae archaeon]MDA7941598.1 hypothetical protein [Nitrosopumilus sp.]MDA7943858.1 hypothetical protein [Nitrosopumilus sp.]MDA7945236.1 hypothetical protein [Nitrosopumilus sp.]